MRSSIYINEGPEQGVTLDFSASPSELAYKGNCYGFAYLKTLEHLGLESQVVSEPEQFATLEIQGSVDKIKDNVPELQKHIGLIARYGAERSGSNHDRQWIGRMLGNLVQERLPQLPEEASLMYASSVIVAPFASMTNDDGFSIYYARQAPWHNPDQPFVKTEDGSALGPFSARDIGGMLIGFDGLPAPKSIGLTLKMADRNYQQLKQLADVLGTNVGAELTQSLRNYLENPSSISRDFSLEGTEKLKVAANFARTDLEKLYDSGVQNEAEFEAVIHYATQSHLDKHAGNAKIQEAIAEKERRQKVLFDGLRVDLGPF